MLCKEDADAIETLRPHYGIHNHSKPGKLNKNIGMPDVSIGVLSNWIWEEDHQLANA